MTKEFQCYAGIDWATEEHEVCLVNSQNEVLGQRSFVHSGTGLAELTDWLVVTSGCSPTEIAVSIEVPHGPVVDTLLERSFAVFAINPKQLDRFRDRFTVAGAKDDRRDAFVLAASLRTDRSCFRRLDVSDPLVIELREWSRMADDLQRERTALANRIREQLRRFYPQALLITDDVAANWFLEFLDLAPTPGKAKQFDRQAFANFLKKKRIRRISAEKALTLLTQPAVTVAPGTVQAASAHIDIVKARLKLVNQQIKTANKRIDGIFSSMSHTKTDDEAFPGQCIEQRDLEILMSLPGIGRIVLATLLAEASHLIQARDYHALRSLCGVAPVTRRSGKRCVIFMRQACHLRLRTAVYHWSRVAIQHDPISKARYADLRKRGHSHGRALRSVADRLLAVACAMLRSQTTYERRPAPNREAA